LNAILKWQEGNITRLFFEGNINSYTFADEGASLYDVLHLYNGRLGSIKDKMIAEMKSMKELEEYIAKTEDTSLAVIVEAVKQFGNQLPSAINELKNHHVANKDEADLIFSTVHRCKGMEYDEVTLLNDFITEEKLKRLVEQNGGEAIKDQDKNRLAEEINILYVAATRVRNKLIIPEEINPLKSIALSPAPAAPITLGKKSYVDDFDYRQSYKNPKRDYSPTFNRFKPRKRF
jgi:superfamily I DNA/RNA helicase